MILFLCGLSQTAPHLHVYMSWCAVRVLQFRIMRNEGMLRKECQHKYFCHHLSVSVSASSHSAEIKLGRSCRGLIVMTDQQRCIVTKYNYFITVMVKRGICILLEYFFSTTSTFTLLDILDKCDTFTRIQCCVLLVTRDGIHIFPHQLFI